MKIYRCDVCGTDFDPENGMIGGYYQNQRKVRYSSPGGRIEDLKAVRTIKLYKRVEKTERITEPHDVEAELDACRSCVMKFERP